MIAPLPTHRYALLSERLSRCSWGRTCVRCEKYATANAGLVCLCCLDHPAWLSPIAREDADRGGQGRPVRPLEHLSHKARCLTPLPFAKYLVELVGAEKIAVLWTERRTLYWQLWPRVEIWGRGRDARKYAGPHPIIGHPPCGPWGNYKAVCRQSKEDGIIAMRLVHEFGGVIEQPIGSSLFREHGSTGEVIKVNQGDYGHPSIKSTALYLVRSQR